MTFPAFLMRFRARPAALCLLAVLLGATACKRDASTPADTTQLRPAEQVQGPPPPESSAETMREYARTHLPPGLAPGDFLTKKADYPTGDTADVYRAVLDTLYVTPSGSAPLVVLSDIADPQMVTCSKMPCPPVPPGHVTKIGEATLDAFRQATLTRRHIRHDFRYHLPIRIVSELDRGAMAEIGRARQPDRPPAGMSEHPFWAGFMTKYPRAWGYAALTSVGMNPEKNEAVLQVRHHCGTYCWSVESMVVRKIDGRWQVIERMPEMSDSTDLGHDFLRYRGVGARKPNAEIRAAAVADSLRLDRLPRGIHGVLTNANGEPIAGATVTLATVMDPNTPVIKVQSDSLGAYRIVNPPADAGPMMVRCPQSTPRRDAVMAVTGVEVKPGKEILFNMAMDGLSCIDAMNSPASIQPPFDAPPLGNAADSARARKATYPSDEEAAVYNAVLNGTASPQPGRTMLVYATTRSLCKGPECADKYWKSIRYVPEVMLVTMESFLAVREKRIDFRSDFPGRPNVLQIGDSTLTALSNVTGRGEILNNWSMIRLAYPAVEIVVSFSPVAFSSHRKQAMVEATQGDINGFTESKMWVLEKRDGEWRTVALFQGASRR